MPGIQNSVENPLTVEQVKEMFPNGIQVHECVSRRTLISSRQEETTRWYMELPADFKAEEIPFLRHGAPSRARIAYEDKVDDFTKSLSDHIGLVYPSMPFRLRLY
ncbi:MAG TPA: hypothetical protein VN701_02615 [Candidatus Paceibacterota bacterium]|nr:hypothetical protein [Candidatus Paceibacterota bacterium]